MARDSWLYCLISIQHSIFYIQYSFTPASRQLLRYPPVPDSFRAQPPADDTFNHRSCLKHLVHVEPGVDSHLVHHHHHILGGDQPGDVRVFIIIAPCARNGDPADEVGRLPAYSPPLLIHS